MVKRSRIGPVTAWLILLGALLLSVGVLAGGAWLLRHQIVARVAEDQLAALGLDGATLQVTAVGFDRVVLSSLRSDPGGTATIRRVEIHFTLRRLIDAGRIDQVAIDGVRLRLADGPDGLDVGGLTPLVDHLAADGAAATPPGRIDLPLDQIRITDARIDLRTPAEIITLTVDGLVRGDDETYVEATASLSAALGTMAFELSMLEREPGRFSGKVTVTDGAVGMAPLEADGLRGTVAFDLVPLSVEAFLAGGEAVSLSGGLTAATATVGRFPFSPLDAVIDARQGLITVALTAAGADTGNRLSAELTVNNPFGLARQPDAAGDSVAAPPSYRLRIDSSLVDTLAVIDRLAPGETDASAGAREAEAEEAGAEDAKTEDAITEDTGGEDTGTPAAARTGAGRIDAGLSGRLPPLQEIDRADLLTLLRLARRGWVDVDLTQLDLPGIGDGLGIDANLNLTVEDDGTRYGISIAAPEPVRLTARRLAPGLVDGFDLPPTVAVLLSEADADDPPLMLVLDAPGPLARPGRPAQARPFGIRVHRVADGQQADIDAAIRLDLRDRLGMQLALSAEAGRPDIVAADGSVDAATAAPAWSIDLSAFDLTATGRPIDGVTGLDLSVTGSGRLDAGGGSGEIAITAAADRVDGPAGPLVLDGPKLTLHHRLSWQDAGDTGGRLTADPVEPVLLTADRLTLPDLRGEGLQVGLPVGLRRAGDRVSLFLQDVAPMVVRSLRIDDGPRSQGPLAVTVTPLPGVGDAPSPDLATIVGGTVSSVAVGFATRPLSLRLPGAPGSITATLPEGRLVLAAAAPAVATAADATPADATPGGPPGTGSTALPMAATLTLRNVSLDLPGQRVSIGGLDVDATGDLPLQTAARLPMVRLRAGRVSDGSSPAVFTPVAVSLDVTPGAGPPGAGASGAGASGEGVSEQGTGTRRVDLDVTVRALNDSFAVSATGHHDLDAGAGGVDLAMDEVRLGTGGARPSDLSPLVGRVLEDVSGGVDLGGTVAWDGGRLASDLALVLRDLTASYGGMTVSTLNTAIRIDQLSPLRTRPDQQIAIGAIDVGLPLTNAVIPFQLTGGRQVSLGETVFDMAGGRVISQAVDLDLDDLDSLFVLQVEDVDVGELLQITELDGLVATGRLNGEIPVRIRGQEIEVLDGKLTADGRGTFAYRPEQPPPGLAGSEQGVTLMLQVLRNFQYETLELDLNRAPDGDTRIKLHLAGSNPDFYDGYPVVFNLNLTGRLDQIVRSNLRFYQAPASVRALQDQYGKGTTRMDKE